MTKTLTVHNAEVRTAAVEVRSLTISGKQVTLAVFRQLIEESPLTSGGEWRGLPWGFVNYLAESQSERKRRNVVWQCGTELRRSLVYEQYKPGKEIWGKPAADWITALVRMERLTKETDYDHADREFRVTDGNFIYHADTPRLKDFNRETRTNDWTIPPFTVEEVDALYEKARADAVRKTVIGQAFFDRWQEVLALEQLFIAV